jgi:hypothetical protein
MIYKRAKSSPAKREGRLPAFASASTLTAYSVCILFDYVAYAATLPLLAGFAIALGDAASHALAVAEHGQASAPVAAQTIVFPVRRRHATVSPVS